MKIPADVLKYLKTKGGEDSSVDVIEVSSDEMASLNQQFMGRSGATDVLSFPLDRIPGEKDNFIGTVIVCGDIIKKQAIQNGKTYQEEFEFLLRHGIDHLLGIHHQ